MTTTPTNLSPEAEKMIEVFTDFINCHAAANREEYIVTRSDYEYQQHGVNDSPKILSDLTHAIYVAEGDLRIITLYASPFHDEGGPNILTGFFRRTWSDEAWDLDELLQYFDTDYSVILHNGHRSDAWPEEVQHEGQ